MNQAKIFNEEDEINLSEILQQTKKIAIAA